MRLYSHDLFCVFWSSRPTSPAAVSNVILSFFPLIKGMSHDFCHKGVVQEARLPLRDPALSASSSGSHGTASCFQMAAPIDSGHHPGRWCYFPITIRNKSLASAETDRAWSRNRYFHFRYRWPCFSLSVHVSPSPELCPNGIPLWVHLRE